MIDPKLLRCGPEAVARNLARRGYAFDVAAFQALEQQRRHWQIETDRLRAARNSHAKAVGQARGRGEDIAPLVREGEALTGELVDGRAAAGGGAGDARAAGSSSCRTCCMSRCRTARTRAPTSRWRARGAAALRFQAA